MLAEPHCAGDWHRHLMPPYPRPSQVGTIVHSLEVNLSEATGLAQGYTVRVEPEFSPCLSALGPHSCL